MAQAALRRNFGAPGRFVTRGVDSLANLGEQLSFMAKSLVDVVPAVRHGGEVARLISEITLGSGALIVGAGTAGVIFFMAFFTGTQVGLEGFKGLQLIGAEAFTGFVSAFANTREITPLIAGVTLAAQVGAGFAQQSWGDEGQRGDRRARDDGGASRALSHLHPRHRRSGSDHAAVSDLAVRLVHRHRIGGHQASWTVGGTYAHYFSLFLPPIDVFYSLIKAVVFAIAVALIHCYYGFNATGAPPESASPSARRSGHPSSS